MTATTHVDDVQRTPLQSLGRRWPIAVALGVAGLVLGIAAALAVETTYTAEARVAVNGGGLSAGAVAGLPLAASQLASNYARYINDQALTGGSGQAVAASPIPESNVIRVEAFASSRRTAQRAAQSAATSLISKVTDSSGGSASQVLDAYSKAAAQSAQADQDQQDAQGRLAELRARDAGASALKSARSQAVTASREAATADLRKQALASQYQNSVGSGSAAQLNLIQPAVVTSSDRTGRVGKYGILGLVLGLAIALAVTTLAERRRVRSR